MYANKESGDPAYLMMSTGLFHHENHLNMIVQSVSSEGGLISYVRGHVLFIEPTRQGTSFPNISCLSLHGLHKELTQNQILELGS